MRDGVSTDRGTTGRWTLADMRIGDASAWLLQHRDIWRGARWYIALRGIGHLCSTSVPFASTSIVHIVTVLSLPIVAGNPEMRGGETCHVRTSPFRPRFSNARDARFIWRMSVHEDVGQMNRAIEVMNQNIRMSSVHQRDPADGSELPTFDKQKYRRHLRGWFSYAFARYVADSYNPSYAEDHIDEEMQFARDNGYLLPDKTQPCNAPVNAPSADAEDARCVVKLGWLWIDSASFSLYVYSISVALQALTVISMGGIADHRELHHTQPTPALN
ncbi:hypothetical protein NUW54_g12536 [Trametes sanguinea]|uniref:Uncharacterized protein n=1 Tax=Trametes sanguinea TaxID=158606 RepID=A0ACC1MWV3_9APHY|nr:hypothetical protein NUW54_g12536 [Trametes sanguinea]